MRSIVGQDGRQLGCGSQRQCCANHGVLQFWIIRKPQWISMSKRDEERARRAYPFGNLPEQLDGDCCDPLALQLCCDQAHGLVAERSDRDQQCDVNAIGYETLCGFGCCLAKKTPRCGDRTHERKVPPVHRADPPLRDQLVDAIDRKGNVRIASHACVVEGFTAMSVDEGMYIGVGRNVPK